MKDPIEIMTHATENLNSTTNGGNHAPENVISDKDTSNSKYTNGDSRVSLSVVNPTDSMRSSCSSLAKSESSQDTPVVSVLKSHKTTSASSGSKKVSINEPPSLTVVKREHAVSPQSDKSHHRHSIINISADKRARKVKFFINGDKFFKGAVIAVNNEKFRTFDKLLEHMTKIMCNQVTLPNGVRYIFSLEGKSVTDLDSILTGESYVCSSLSCFKKLDYISLAGQFQTIISLSQHNIDIWGRMLNLKIKSQKCK